MTLLHAEIYSSPGAVESIVLIHGMGSASTAWEPILEDLRARFTVITVDLPGHGKSPFDSQQAMDPQSLAHVVIETMRERGFENFHLVGNSLGGWISLEMAANNPSAISSVTALAPAGLWLHPYTTRSHGTAISRMLAKSVKVLSPFLLSFEWARKIGFASVSPLWKNFAYKLCLDAAVAMATSTGYYSAWDALLNKRFDKINRYRNSHHRNLWRFR